MAKSNALRTTEEEANKSLPAINADLSLNTPFDDDSQSRGVSQRAEDNLIPMATVLQPLSPVLTDPRQAIEGAKAGDWLLKNCPVPLVKGQEGLLVQPVELDIKWVEWRPREAGGGLVAQHAARPAEAKEVIDGKTGRASCVMPNGNTVIETAYRVTNVILPDGRMFPLAIPFSSTGHTARRKWETLMNTFFTPSHQVVDAYAVIYRLRTIQRTNAFGTWFVPEATAERKASAEEKFRGRKLWDALNAGEKQVDVSGLEDERVAAGVPPRSGQQSGDEDTI
jgi:hypothetical protein